MDMSRLHHIYTQMINDCDIQLSQRMNRHARDYYIAVRRHSFQILLKYQLDNYNKD